MTLLRPSRKTLEAGARKRFPGVGSAKKRAIKAKTVAGDTRSIVNSLSKGLRVLEAFSTERPELTLSEVASIAGIDPGTAYRMLNTLVMLGYVARTPSSRCFRLTLKVLNLGSNAIGRADLREVARPVLRSLVGEVSEAASLGVLDGSDILYLERVRAGLTRIGVDIRIGTTIPATSSAIGQAVLASLPERELAKVLAIQSRSDGLSPKPMSRDEIRRDLDDTREHGFSLRDSYFGSGLRILAVPVLDVDGYPLAAVSVAAPAVRMSMAEFRARTLNLVRGAASDIALAIQASGTTSIT